MITRTDIIRWLILTTMLAFIWMGNRWAIAIAFSLIFLGDEVSFMMQKLHFQKEMRKQILDLMGGTKN